ncbi:histidine phosphatase family protein [Streptococcus suis]|uniref:histidine phosphatase family protein n=1 Tax=Streptococcus suis TaxID=1307 RepID=UPI00301013DC
MNYLYLMRHGQTRFNLQGRIQGACDSPLTEEGKEQARAAGRYFQEQAISFDKIYSSTQERACDTAELVTGRMDYIRLKGLKEQDFGAFEGQQEYLNPPLQGDIGYGDYFVTFGGESYQDVRQRMVETIGGIMEEADNQSVLVVSHGAAIAQFFRQVLTNYPQVRMRNCAILTFDYEDGKYDLVSVVDPVNREVLYQQQS